LPQSESSLSGKSLLPQLGIHSEDTGFSPPQQPYTHLCLGFGVGGLGSGVCGFCFLVLGFGFGVKPLPFVREHALVAGRLAHGTASDGADRLKDEVVGAQPRHQPDTVCVTPALRFRF